MELNALNAIVAAARADRDGAAFAFVAGELRRNSVTVGAEADRLARQTSELVETIDGLREQFGARVTGDEEFFSTFPQRLAVSFQECRRATDQLASAARKVGERIDRITSALSGIMEGVQRHDIVRQSIGSVRSSLQQVLSRSSAGAEAVEPSQSPVLVAVASSAVLAEIMRQIEYSRSVFAERLAQIDQILPSLALQSDTASDQQGRTIKATFDESASVVDELLHGLEESESVGDEVAAVGDTLMKGVESLDRELTRFARRTSLFKPMSVALVIEVSKRITLSDRRHTVDEMSALVARIAADINDASGVLSAGATHVLGGMRRFALQFRASRGELEAARRRIGEYHQALVEWGGELLEILARLSGAAAEFGQMVGSLRDRLDRLADAERELSLARERLDSIAGSDNASEEDKHGGDRIRELIDGYTVYADKQVAADASGTEIEAGKASGTFTQF